MAKYKKPRRLNPVSFLFLLLAAAGVYALVQFGPPYWRKYQVKGVIKDAAARAILHPELPRLQRETETKLRELGVKSPTINVSFRKGGGQVEAMAEYVETIEHPLVNKITTLSFRPAVVVLDERAR